jgi:hypothetical protein
MGFSLATGLRSGRYQSQRRKHLVVGATQEVDITWPLTNSALTIATSGQARQISGQAYL